MKNLKLITLTTLAFATIASIVLVGCMKMRTTHTKNDFNNEHYSSKKIIELDKKINFNSNYKNFEGRYSKLTTKQGAVVVVADVKGGIDGFKIGSKIGAATGPYGPLVTMGGTLLGAVISSGFTWWAMDGLVLNPQGIPLSPPYWSATLTYNSNFEKIGYWHNSMIMETFIKRSDIPFDFNNYFDRYYDEYAEKISHILQFPTTYLKNTTAKNEFKKTLITIPHNIFDFKTALAEDSISELEYNILIDCMERIYIINNMQYDLIYQYAEEYINLIQKDTRLSSENKINLLFYLNILKYSTSLWKNNIN